MTNINPVERVQVAVCVVSREGFRQQSCEVSGYESDVTEAVKCEIFKTLSNQPDIADKCGDYGSVTIFSLMADDLTDSIVC